MKPLPFLHPITLFLGILFGAGCAPQPPPDFYLLNASAPTRLPGLEQGVCVGLGPMEIAPYLEGNQIVTRESDTQVSLSDQSRWAEPLKAGLIRVLLINLSVDLDSNCIYGLPLRRTRQLDYQVPIDVLRFDNAPGKTDQVVLGAHWALLSGDEEETITSKVSRIREPIDGADVSAFVAAQSRALGKLSAEIAAAIKEVEEQ